MAQYVDFDGTAKLIIVKTGVTELNVQTDIYSDWKEWVLEGNANFLPALYTVGGDPITDVLSVSGYYFLQNGWKIRPAEWDHRLVITGNLFTDDQSAVTVDTLGPYRVEVSLILSANAQTTSLDLTAIKRNTDLIPALV